MNVLSRSRATICLGILAMPLLTLATVGQPVTDQAVKALAVTQTCVDCTAYRGELCELFDLLRGCNVDFDSSTIDRLVRELNEHPAAVDARCLKAEVTAALDALSRCPCNHKPKGFTSIESAAQKAVALCNGVETRAVRSAEATEYDLPVFDAPEGVTRAAADQWVVTGPTGGTVTFDPTLLGTPTAFKMDQDIRIGSIVTFNGVTSNTGSPLALDAIAGQNVNIGNASAAAVNIATAGVATAVSLGTGSTVATLSIGNSTAGTNTTSVGILGGSLTGGNVDVDAFTLNLGTAGTSEAINIGNSTAGTNTTSVSIAGGSLTGGNVDVDAYQLNIGTTNAEDINIGQTDATTANIDILGLTTRIDGTTNTYVGNTNAKIVTVGNITADTNKTVTSVLGGSLSGGSVGADAYALNLGTTYAENINIGQTDATTTAIDILGLTTRIDGTTNTYVGNTNAKIVTVGNITADTNKTVTSVLGGSLSGGSVGADAYALNLGTTYAEDINIGQTDGTTTNVDILGVTVALTGSTAITHTGPTRLLPVGGNASELQFYNPAGTYKIGIKADVIPSADLTTLTLPIANGSSGQTLINNGSGVLSWGGVLANTALVDAGRKTSNQTITTVPETVIFNDELLDPGTKYNPGTGEYTVPTTGNYWINAQVCLEPKTIGTKQIDVVRTTGGALTGKYESYIVVPVLVQSGSPAIYETYMINLGCIVPLVKDDVIVIQYTGLATDIVHMDASHLSAFMVSA